MTFLLIAGAVFAIVVSRITRFIVTLGGLL